MASFSSLSRVPSNAYAFVKGESLSIMYKYKVRTWIRRNSYEDMGEGYI